MACQTAKGVSLGRAFRVAAFAAALLFSDIAAWTQQYAISTIAGGVPPPTPAVATSSSIGAALGMAVDAAGNIYFTSFHCVFKVSGTTITRLAGTGRPGFSGDGGPAVNAQLNFSVGDGVDSGVALGSE